MLEEKVKTNVRIIDSNSVVLSKLDDASIEYKTYVCRAEYLAFVFSIYNGKPVVTYCRKLESQKDVYAKWVYLIGKLSLKCVESKYFKNVRVHEHFNNGDALGETDRKIIMSFIDGIRGLTMTNQEILQIALQQSAYDCNCNAEDFLLTENKVVLSQKNEKARVYMPLPLECDLVSYGNNIVAQVSPRMKETVEWYIGKYAVEHCFESPNVIVLNEKLAEFGYKVCFMAEYFLPDVNELKELSCDHEIKVLYPEYFEQYYTAEWGNALCKSRKHLDKLAVGAFDNGKLIGLAGCSADCETMYQIGVDVLPEYRRKGVASAITSKLAIETLKLGKVPFYCVAWSNIKSVRNAIRSGFRPAWVELTARNSEFVDEMNK